MQTRSILQDWVMQLGLRHQGTLLTIIRGSDSWSKHAPQKPLIREMRGLILTPFDPRELEKRGFMTAFPDPESPMAWQFFLDHIDNLPVHYVMHVLHACQIIGYCYPLDGLANDFYLRRYFDLCAKFHLNPETGEQMHARLNEDRIAANSVES